MVDRGDGRLCRDAIGQSEVLEVKLKSTCGVSGVKPQLAYSLRVYDGQHHHDGHETMNEVRLSYVLFERTNRYNMRCLSGCRISEM